MDAQTATLSVVLLVGLAPLLLLLKESSSRAARGLGVAVWLAFTAAVTAGAARYERPRAAADAAPVTGRPIEIAADSYVSSKECRACHVQEYGSWHDSFHRRMTQVVSPDTVQARFDGEEIVYRGERWRFFRDGGKFFVEMDEPAWDAASNAAADPKSRSPTARASRPRVVRELVLSTGSHHYEAFWFTDERTRKVSLAPFCWRIDQQRWMAVDAAFLVPADEEQGSEGRWNIACNKCHSTHPKPLVAGQFDMQTEVAEFGIACEACHGPGAEHVAENSSPLDRYARHFAGATVEAGGKDSAGSTITDPRELDPVRSAMVCGQCHAAVEYRDAAPKAQAQRNANGQSFRPGDDVNVERRMRTAGAEKFWPDGMIRTSGREYNGLLHSPCYEHGDRARGIMTCLSCHQMHQGRADPRPRAEWASDQLAPGMDGDRACTQCHSQFDAPNALEAHTHHAAASIGSRCMDCHMPYTTYGLLKSLRSHTIASPTLTESIDVGRPNACNLCHLDQTLQWAGERLAEWYGQPEPEAARRSTGLAQDEKSLAAGALWITRGDAGLRALVTCAMERPEARATCGSDWFAPLLAPLLQDPYYAVRLLSERTLQSLPELADFDLRYHYLDEPARLAEATARVRAAWEQLPPARRPSRAPRVLIDESGRFDDVTLARLLAQRDDRRVVLAE